MLCREASRSNLCCSPITSPLHTSLHLVYQCRGGLHVWAVWFWERLFSPDGAGETPEHVWNRFKAGTDRVWLFFFCFFFSFFKWSLESQQGERNPWEAVTNCKEKFIWINMNGKKWSIEKPRIKKNEEMKSKMAFQGNSQTTIFPSLRPTPISFFPLQAF